MVFDERHVTEKHEFSRDVTNDGRGGCFHDDTARDKCRRFRGGLNGGRVRGS